MFQVMAPNANFMIFAVGLSFISELTFEPITDKVNHNYFNLVNSCGDTGNKYIVFISSMKEINSRRKKKNRTNHEKWNEGRVHDANDGNYMKNLLLATSWWFMIITMMRWPKTLQLWINYYRDYHFTRRGSDGLLRHRHEPN